MKRHAGPIALAVSLCCLALGPTGASAALPTISNVQISAVTTTSATLEAKINPGKKSTFFHFEYGSADCASNPCTSIPSPEPNIGSGNSPVLVKATAPGLSPGTTYHYRVVAHHANGTDEVTSADRVFTTQSLPPAFGPCANDAFRTGQPSAALSDCRAYEQASPVDKNGSDLTASFPNTRASIGGDRITFSSFAPLPGSESAQTFTPLYMASRGVGGWSLHSILPPQAVGENGLVVGWTPDLSHVFDWARNIGEPNTTTLIDRSTVDGSVTTIVPHTAGFSEPKTAGSSDDGSIVFFEFEGPPLLPGAPVDKVNLYVWDRETGTVRLAGVFNDENAPAFGAVAGSEGAEGRSFTRDMHAIAPDGSSVYFTDPKTGQLYLRVNPTEPQSALDEGECIEADRACTIQVSASQRDEPDPAGTADAAFQVASVDGAEAFFTSSEELTNDANTGPVQPPAQIGRAKLGLSGPEDPEPGFLLTHALGMATSPDGEYIYWANPTAGTIGRAKLNGEDPPTEIDSEYVVPGPTEAVTDPAEHPGVFESAPSTPRYVAVDSEYVYWTNTGPLGENLQGARHRPMNGGGTIGRARIGPVEGEEIKPEFIKGATDPQGIAVDSEYVYWANSGAEGEANKGLGRATTAGAGTDQEYCSPFALGLGINKKMQGIAIHGADLYIGLLADGDSAIQINQVGSCAHVGGDNFVAGSIRGVAVDGSHVYWTTQGLGERSIGRNTLDLNNEESEFIKPGGTLFGVATDAEHVYWSVNGETPPNPGSDLYRYAAATGALTDLTPDPSDINGADVRGVLGASADGSYLYFVANAVLADTPNAAGEEASAGSCHGAGENEDGFCNLYLLHEGQVEFIAPVAAGGGGSDSWRMNARAAGGGYKLRASRVSPDGRTLLFRTRERLTAYESNGTPELYRYRVGAGIECVSCNPTGAPPTSGLSEGPGLSSIFPSGFSSLLSPPVFSRNLSADGNRVFFETFEGLVAADVNGNKDVYEWEAKGSGSCKSEAQNGGCLYLLSTGTSPEPSYFSDASASGDDVFFFTRAQLTGQDEDELVDVYDARVEGGLASQGDSPPPIPCEGEACKGSVTPAPESRSPGTANFSRPGKKPTPRCAKGKHRANGRCVMSHKRHRKAHHNRRAGR